jgi:hypothetical protein
MIVRRSTNDRKTGASAVLGGELCALARFSIAAALVRFAVLLLIAAAMVVAARASDPASRNACGPRETIVASLAKYAETPAAMGLTAQGTLLEVFAAPSGSWSIIVTTAHGISCLVAAGDAWAAAKDPEKPGA